MVTAVDGVISIIFPALVCAALGTLSTFTDHPQFDEHPWIVLFIRCMFGAAVLFVLYTLAVVLPKINWGFK